MKLYHFQLLIWTTSFVAVLVLMLNGNPWYHWMWFNMTGVFAFTLEDGDKRP